MMLGLEDTVVSNRSNAIPTQGWTSQPNGRGTIDIVWSCVFTIFLCSWSVLCINVPAEDDTKHELFLRKFGLTGLGILGPEFIMQSALGQYISARRSVTAFKSIKGANWTINHAFFADMGGFFLKTPDFPPFPIDAMQLQYLVENGYIPMPTLTKREIKDRNKVDSLLRIITVAQTLWFFLSTIARAVQHLAITTFELTAVGFIFCTLGTHLCWWHKPADVDTPVTIHCDLPMSRILIEAGDAAKQPYSRTPLDFISRREWSWSLWWNFILNVLRKLHITFAPQERPITRIPNDSWPEIPHAGIFILGLVDMAYAGIYLSGWNFYFATHIERVLWWTSTLTILGCVVAYLIVEAYTIFLIPFLRERFQFSLHSARIVRKRNWRDESAPRRIHGMLNWMRNSSQSQDPELYMPLKGLIPITAAAVVYCVARGYMLLECLLVLRELPASAYETVQWTNFLPHV